VEEEARFIALFQLIGLCALVNVTVNNNAASM
jgi:hypothetical protein